MKLKIYVRQGEEAREIRKEGNIPAIVYGKHIAEPLSIFCGKNEFIKMFKQFGYSTALTLEGKGLEELVLVQDMQLDPVSNVLLHVDFLAVRRDEKVKAEVPVIIFGESPIEKLGEGKIQLVKDFVEVEAFPQDLPRDIKIDISTIVALNDTIFVKDLDISDKVKVLGDIEQPILIVSALAEEVEEVVEDKEESSEEDAKTDGDK